MKKKKFLSISSYKKREDLNIAWKKKKKRNKMAKINSRFPRFCLLDILLHFLTDLFFWICIRFLALLFSFSFSSFFPNCAKRDQKKGFFLVIKPGIYYTLLPCFLRLLYSFSSLFISKPFSLHVQEKKLSFLLFSFPFPFCFGLCLTRPCHQKLFFVCVDDLRSSCPFAWFLFLMLIFFSMPISIWNCLLYFFFYRLFLSTILL